MLEASAAWISHLTGFGLLPVFVRGLFSCVSRLRFDVFLDCVVVNSTSLRIGNLTPVILSLL